MILIDLNLISKSESIMYNDNLLIKQLKTKVINFSYNTPMRVILIGGK